MEGSKMRTLGPKLGAPPSVDVPPPHVGVVVQLGGQLCGGRGDAPASPPSSETLPGPESSLAPTPPSPFEALAPLEPASLPAVELLQAPSLDPPDAALHAKSAATARGARSARPIGRDRIFGSRCNPRTSKIRGESLG
jgi:hypothetical protein